MGKFVFGSFIYYYQLIRQDRKTLSLTVTPDLKIIVKVPFKADSERIENFLKRKWFWLEKQLRFFKKYQRKVYKKEFVSGESFWYLGRQYQLIVKHSNEDKVALTKGKLISYTQKDAANSAYNKKLVSGWYQEKAYKTFLERLAAMNQKFGYKITPKLVIRDMKKRWGSFIGKDKVILNPRLIGASKDCIDYVIAHELCHFKYKNHNTKFYNLLENKFPKWEKVKDKLERYPI